MNTAFCVDFLNGDVGAVELAKRIDADGEDLIVPSPVLVEFLAWPLAKGGVALRTALQLVSRMRTIDVTEGLAKEAARLGSDCIKSGHEKTAFDLVVAATAMANACPMITRDRAFTDIPGLTVLTY